MTTPRTSGATITEAERLRRDQHRLQLRVSVRTLRRLEKLCGATGDTRSEQIAALVDAEFLRRPLA